MAPVIPDPGKIRSFRTEAAFEKWLARNHDRETELWLKIHKKDSGLPTVTYAQALDVALCHGCIDGKQPTPPSAAPPNPLSPTTFVPP